MVWTKEVFYTIPDIIPQNKIAVLKLDTDFYDSTYHELVHLYPLVSKHGVILLDDYGMWLGQRTAVDSYIDEHKCRILLNRTDCYGSIGVKTE